MDQATTLARYHTRCWRQRGALVRDSQHLSSMQSLQYQHCTILHLKCNIGIGQPCTGYLLAEKMCESAAGMKLPHQGSMPAGRDGEAAHGRARGLREQRQQLRGDPRPPQQRGKQVRRPARCRRGISSLKHPCLGISLLGHQYFARKSFHVHEM